MIVIKFVQLVYAYCCSEVQGMDDDNLHVSTHEFTFFCAFFNGFAFIDFLGVISSILFFRDLDVFTLLELLIDFEGTLL